MYSVNCKNQQLCDITSDADPQSFFADPDPESVTSPCKNFVIPPYSIVKNIIVEVSIIPPYCNSKVSRFSQIDLLHIPALTFDHFKTILVGAFKTLSLFS